MVSRRGVLAFGGLTAISAMLVVSGCSGEQRSAAGPSAEAMSSASASSTASVSASVGVVAGGGVPGMPRLSWKAAGHVVTLSLRPAAGSVPVDGYEIAVGQQGAAADLSTVQSCAAVAGSMDATACPLTLKRGGWDVFVRAVNQGGASDWLQGPSVSIYRCTDADAVAGVCEEFDTGPGGGFVFYDAGTRESWGRYLEAAPPGWSGSPDDPQKLWCSSDEPLPGYKNTLATGTQIGSGASNTALIIQNCGSDTAAGLAAAYRGGGKTDWFLPSKDELAKVYDRRTEIGAPADVLWSSSQSSNYADDAWCQDFTAFAQGWQNPDGDKAGTVIVRPVRAF